MTKTHQAAFLSLLPFTIIVSVVLLDVNQIQHIDNLTTLEVISWRNDFLISLFSKITFLANPPTVVVLTTVLIGLAYFTTRTHHLSLWILLTNIVGSLGINPLVKELFQRARPDKAIQLVVEKTFSFPSGHAFASVLLYGCLIILITRLMKKSHLRTVLITFIGLLIFLIGFSRIFLAAHYLSDVVGGFSLGLFWLLISYSFYTSKFVTN